jgi:uncharacterized membrane protein YhaH (DUF805 family)
MIPGMKRCSSGSMFTMNCPTCGKENESSAQFCGICGTQLSDHPTAINQDDIDPSSPMVGFGEAISLGFKNYINFNGRATRAEYWWWFLFIVVTGVVLGTIDSITGIGALQNIFNLATLIPGLALGARRLHDIGKSGWWQLLWFAIIVGWIIMIVWYCKPGNQPGNKYNI